MCFAKKIVFLESRPPEMELEAIKLVIGECRYKWSQENIRR
jgi:hypothetical protein